MRKMSLVVTTLTLVASLAFADPVPESVPVIDADVSLLPVSSELPRRARVSWAQPALGRSHSGAPEVLFTFDDGPSGGHTDSVLDTLKAHGVHAVFFLVGRQFKGSGRARATALVERMLAEGHAVGNHTESHKDLCLKTNAARIDDEIDGSARELGAVSGMNMILFRAPYGARCARLEAALGARHLSHLHWDVDPQEWRSHDAARTQAVIIGALGKLRDDQRAVVLTHDTHPATVTALPVILEWIRNENVRRTAAGRKPIKILSPSDVAAEQLAPPLRAFLASIELGAGMAQLEHRFVAPLTAPRAQAGVPSL